MSAPTEEEDENDDHSTIVRRKSTSSHKETAQLKKPVRTMIRTLPQVFSALSVVLLFAAASYNKTASGELLVPVERLLELGDVQADSIWRDQLDWPPIKHFHQSKRQAALSFSELAGGNAELVRTSALTQHQKQQQQQQRQHLIELRQEPPNELVFANQTGAIVQCGVALELARGIAKADLSAANKPTTAGDNGDHQQRSSSSGFHQMFPSSSSSSSSSSGYLGASVSLNQPNLANSRLGDIQIRWEKENGDEAEQTLYANGNSAEIDQNNANTNANGANANKPLRFQRPSDGALVFEPFRPADFRPDVHATTYRCMASLAAKGASLVSRDMRVRALLVSQASQLQVEVLDQLVVEGASATFKCQIPLHAQDYLQVLDWVEFPGEQVHNFQSSTLDNANNHLFHPTSANNVGSTILQKQHKRQQLINTGEQISAQNNSNKSSSKYFVAPKSGDLHIINVDASLNYRSFKCRCKNKLTGELIGSINKGKLIVSESHSPMAPRIIAESQLQQQQQQPIYEEGELALLACNMQSFSRASVSWFKRLNDLESEPIETDHIKFAQIASLLLIRQVNRNDSGVYLCQVKNSAGEERLEVELQVKAGLKAKLSASASVLELGKSLALECTVKGHPIHQVVFRHNGRVIKSISGQVANGQHFYGPNRRRLIGQQQPQQQWQASSEAATSGSYFVVDSVNESDKRTGGSKQPDASQLARTQADGSDNFDDDVSEIKLSHVIVIVLEPQHAGAYQCFAYNQYESIQASTYIRVLDDPPKFKDTFKSEVFEQRQDISLQCSARANPLPEITWTVDEQPIPETGRQRFGDFVAKDNLVISYVNISQAQVIDSGQYRCTADNGLAQVSHQAQISVLGALQIKPMANVTAVASTTFRVRCPVSGYPVSDIQWQHNGRRLPANHRQHVYENGTLEVEHMEKSQGDDGEYTCVASGQTSEPVHSSPDRAAGETANSPAPPVYGSLHVSIKVRPTIEPFTISHSLREGQRASIMCTISSGDLPISISWFRNEQPLAALPTSVQQAPQVAEDATSSISQAHHSNGTHLAGVRISRVSDYSSTLLFESLLAQHSANYTCLARNDAGQVSHQAPMIVQVAPKWSIEPADTNIVRGTSMSIDCMAIGFPPARIIWTKSLQEQSSPGSSATNSAQQQQQQQQQQTVAANSNAKLHHHHHHLGNWRSIVSSPHLQVYENGSLNILDARDSDFGHYMCQASNGVGPGLSKVIKVTINVAAQLSGRHSVQYVAKGEQAHLKCQAKGDYPIGMHWFKNSNRLEPINLQNSVLVGANQPLAYNSASHSNNVVSSASSQQALLSSTIASLLLLPASTGSPLQALPLEQLAGADASQRSGLDALLNTPPQQQQDTLAQLDLVGRKQQQQQQGILLQKYSLANTELALSGTRLASASAPAGDTASANGQQPVVAQLSSLLSISQVDRQDTATFKCFAANQFGIDERTIQLIVQEVPERIDELSVFEASSRSVTLAWLAPYDGNAPITSYLVQYRALPKPANSGGQQQPLALLVGGVSVGEPTDWLNYTLQTSGASNNNNNNADNNSSSVQLYLAGSPNAPTLASRMSGLEAPPSGGGSANLVKLTIQSLRPVTHYWFRVVAENKLGAGPASGLVEALTMEEAPGAAPTKLKAVAQSSSSILVSWSKVSDKEVFGSVNGYYVAYKPLPNGDSTGAPSGQQGNKSYIVESPFNEQQQQQSPPVTNIYKTIQHEEKLSKFDALLSGLKRSTRYMISVQAFNNRGTGPSTEPIVLRTLDLDPPRQVKLHMKQATNCTLKLEWTPISLAAAQHQAAQQTDKEPHPGTANPSGHILPLAMPLLGSDGKHLFSAEQQAADVVDYYNLYQAELNERPRWQEVRLPGHLSAHTVEGLRCGTRYQFYMMGVNRIGVGDQSDILDTKTAGGLPLAPDRQSTFDVINTTCYTIRLDHWQDNGCPIREFNVRFKPEQAREWTQLAHFNLMAAPGEPGGGDNEAEPTGRGAIGEVAPAPSSRQSKRLFSADSMWPSRKARRQVSPNLLELDELRSGRFRRSASIDKEDIYVFANDNENNDAGEHYNDDEDSFFDYAVETDANLGSDYGGDLARFAPNKRTVASTTNSSALISVSADPGKKLFSLLKDSMSPTFAGSSDLNVQTRLEAGQYRESSGGNAKEAGSPVAQSWKAAEFAGESSQSLRTQTLDSQQSGNSRTVHAIRQQSMALIGGDWRRVRFCNLIEHTYYSVQVTALNSVGETEAELRLLTSIEGLEYDEDIKRQVVGKLDGDRMAQSVISTAMRGDRFSLLAISQWQILLPATVIVALLALMLAFALRRSAPSGGSTSTTTTTASNSSSANHCHNYLANNKHHGTDSSPSLFRQQVNEGGARGTGARMFGDEEQLADGYAMSAPRLDGFSLHNGTMTIYQAHRADHSVFGDNGGGGGEEPAYGVSGLSGHLNAHSSNLASFSNAETNRSSGSPATTVPSSSMNSGSTNCSERHPFSGQHRHHGTMFVRAEPAPQATGTQQINAKTLGRNVYLCSTGVSVKDDLGGGGQVNEHLGNKPNIDKANMFYGMTALPAPAQTGGANLYGHHQTVQLRHFQQQPDEIQLNANKEAANSAYLSSQPQAMFQQANDLYGGLSQSQVNNLIESNSCENGNKQLDNCFMSIVEEVARAKDTLANQQQRSGQLELANDKPDQQHLLEQQSFATNDQTAYCNQTDCFNRQHFPSGAQSMANMVHQTGQLQTSNYATVMNSSTANEFQTDPQKLGGPLNEHHQQTGTEQQQSSNNRMMFDPVYSTIRRTFPQAIRYLTLQHSHHIQADSGNNLPRFSIPQQQQQQQQVPCDIENSHNS